MDNFTLKNKTVAFLGKRASGKSRLIRYLLMNYKNEFDKIFIVCPTEPINSFYKDIIPEDCIFSSFEDEWIQLIIKKMTKITSEVKDENYKHVLILFDDCGSEENFYKSNPLRVLHVRGRHIKISTILSIQYLNMVSPQIRANLDYLFVGQQNQQSLSILTDEFLYGNLTKQEFIKMYHKNTSDYRFLVINCNSVENNSDLNLLYGTIRTPEKYIK